MKILILLIIGLTNILFGYSNNKIVESDNTQTKIKPLNVNIINEVCEGIGLKKSIYPPDVPSNFNILLSSNLKEGGVFNEDGSYFIENDGNNAFLKYKNSGEGDDFILGKNAKRVESGDGYIYRFKAEPNNFFGFDSSCTHILKSAEIYIISTDNKNYDNTNTQLQTEIDGYTENIKTTAKKITDLSEKIRSLELEIEEEGLEGEVRDILFEMATINIEISEAQTQIDEYNSEISQLSTTKEEVSRLLANISDIEENIKKLNESFSKLEIEYNNLVKRYNRIMAEYETLSNFLADELNKVNSVCGLRHLVNDTLKPAIVNKKKYNVRYLKGKVQLDKLIYIDY